MCVSIKLKILANKYLFLSKLLLLYSDNFGEYLILTDCIAKQSLSGYVAIKLLE